MLNIFFVLMLKSNYIDLFLYFLHEFYKKKKTHSHVGTIKSEKIFDFCLFVCSREKNFNKNAFTYKI